MSTYKVILIVESSTESLCLQTIITNSFLDIEIIGIAQTIKDGILLLQNNRPNIVFFDVKFQNTKIFDCLEKFDLDGVEIIFISTEREFAVNAFEVSALDFILKPLKEDKVVKAVNKAIEKIDLHIYLNNSAIEKNNSIEYKQKIDFIGVSSQAKINIIKTDNIVYFASDGKYTTFHLLDGKKIVSSKNIGFYEKSLDDFFFQRIHNSHIINIKYLTSISRNNGLICELIDEIYLPISKKRQRNFVEVLKLKL